MKTVQNLLFLAIFGFSTIAALDEVALTHTEIAEILKYIVSQPADTQKAYPAIDVYELSNPAFAAEVAHDLNYDEDSGCPRGQDHNPSCLDD